MTDNQLGVYYECMQNPDEIKYTMPTVLRLDDKVDASKLKQAIVNAVEAHPYIKTRIITTDDGTLKQERNDNTEIDEIEIDNYSDSKYTKQVTK